MWRPTITAVVLSALFLAGAPGAEAQTPRPVFVSIVPQKYFVDKIGGKLVEVSVMVKPGASPATYEPKPRQMTKIARTDIYFAIGVPFEKVWLTKIAAANPNLLVVHTDQGIQKAPVDADHQTAAGHDHDVADPHIWLSPPLVKVQALHIRNALVKLSPDHRFEYESNYQRFLKEIDALHAELKQMLAAKQGMRFIVFHPSWGYFARAYGLKQIAVEVEGKEPKAAQLKELIEHARDNDIKVIFVQPQFSAKAARLIADAIGGQAVVTDPLAFNWSQNLREVADKFAAALR